MPARRRPARPIDAPERWLILCRQSDTDDAGERSLSLDSQERVLRDAAAEHGAIVVAALRDADLKGYQDETQRPALAEALRRADAGEVDVLAVWELSRLARKLSLQERVLDRLDAAGVRLHSHREPWASATMVRQILGAVAEEQTRSISAHVRRAMRERRHRGKWHGHPPYGYRGAGDGQLEPDPVTADWARSVFMDYAAGVPVAGIVHRLTVEAAPLPRAGMVGLAWYGSTVRRMIRNVAYTGHQLVDGQPVPAAHPALIDELTWQRCQRRADADADYRGRLRRSRWTGIETFLNDGRLRCACGHTMYPARNRHQVNVEPFLICGGPTVHRGDHGPAYPLCTIRPRQIRIRIAEDRVRALLRENLAALRPWRHALAEARRALAAGGDDRERRRHALTQRQDAALLRQSRARGLYVTGRIELDELDRLSAGAATELAAVAAELAGIVATPDPDAFRATAALARQYAGLIAVADRDMMARTLDDLGIGVVHDPTVEGRIQLTWSGPLAALIPVTER